MRTEPPGFLKTLFHAMQPVVFLGSAALVIVFVTFGAGFTETAATTFQTVQDFIIRNFGWFYILSATALLLTVIWLLLFSGYGDIRLGGPDAEPEYGNLSWFSMLFAAGMGIGLVFWGVAEPLSHFQNPPSAEAGTTAAIREAMRVSYFHWGLHPWGVYIIFSLAIAYFHFRHELPLAPRSLLYPLIGERIYGGLGHLVDIIATVGTLFGVATSLGLGAMQINTGLSEIAGVPDTTWVQVVLIAIITGVATISVVSGIDKGIRSLSVATLILAAVLLGFVLVVGPTVYILKLFISSLGGYLESLPRLSFHLDLARDAGWQGDWTLFYWSWWISWSPFVGIFVARVSRGRSIRQFILGVLLAPTLVTFLWLAAFGGAALYEETRGAGELASVVSDTPALGLYALLERLPLSGITTVLGTLLVVIFFITSSDSGSLVDDMVTSGGHPSPPTVQRIFWALSEGTVAATLLMAGGLEALQTASLTSGLPMTVFLLVASYGLLKALRVDNAVAGRPAVQELQTSPGDD